MITARALAGALGVSVVFALARLLGALSLATALSASAVVAAAALLLAWRLAPRTGRAAALAVETRTATAQNLLVTAAELVETPLPVRADVRDVVLRDAGAVASSIDLARLFPARRALTELGAGALKSCRLPPLLAMMQALSVRAGSPRRGGRL